MKTSRVLPIYLTVALSGMCWTSVEAMESVALGVAGQAPALMFAPPMQAWSGMMDALGRNESFGQVLKGALPQDTAMGLPEAAQLRAEVSNAFALGLIAARVAPEAVGSMGREQLFAALAHGQRAQTQALRELAAGEDPRALSEAVNKAQRLVAIYTLHGKTDALEELGRAQAEAHVTLHTRFSAQVFGSVAGVAASLGKSVAAAADTPPASAETPAVESPHVARARVLIQELHDSDDTDVEERTIGRLKALAQKRSEERLQLVVMSGLSKYIEDTDNTDSDHEDQVKEAVEAMSAIARASPFPSVAKAAAQSISAHALNEDYSHADDARKEVENIGKRSDSLAVKQAAHEGLLAAYGEVSDDDNSDYRESLMDSADAVLGTYPVATQGAVADPAAQAAHVQAEEAAVSRAAQARSSFVQAILTALGESDDSDNNQPFLDRLTSLAKSMKQDLQAVTQIIDGLLAELDAYDDAEDYDISVMRALQEVAQALPRHAAYAPIHGLMLDGIAKYVGENENSNTSDMIEVIENIAAAGTLAVKAKAVDTFLVMFHASSETDEQDSALDAAQRVMDSDPRLAAPAVAVPASQAEDVTAPPVLEAPYLQVARSLLEKLHASTDEDEAKGIIDKLQALAAREDEALQLLIVRGIVEDLLRMGVNVDAEDYAIGRLEDMFDASTFPSIRAAVLAGIMDYLKNAPDPINRSYVAEVIERLAKASGLGAKRRAVQGLLDSLPGAKEAGDKEKLLDAMQAILDSDAQVAPAAQAQAAAPVEIEPDGKPLSRDALAAALIEALSRSTNAETNKKLVDRLEAMGRADGDALRLQILQGLFEKGLESAADSDYAAYVIRAVEGLAEGALDPVRSAAVQGVLRYLAAHPGFPYSAAEAAVVERLALASGVTVKQEAIDGLLAAYEPAHDPVFLDAAAKIAGSDAELSARTELPKRPRAAVEPVFKSWTALLASMASVLAVSGIGYGLLQLAFPVAAVLGVLAGLAWLVSTGIASRRPMAATAQTLLLGAFALFTAALPVTLGFDSLFPMGKITQDTIIAAGGWLFLLWGAVAAVKTNHPKLGLAINAIFGLALNLLLHWDRVWPLVQSRWPF